MLAALQLVVLDPVQGKGRALAGVGLRHALITTAAGLAVAIPSLRRISWKLTSERVASTFRIVISLILPGGGEADVPGTG